MTITAHCENCSQTIDLAYKNGKLLCGYHRENENENEIYLESKRKELLNEIFEERYIIIVDKLMSDLEDRKGFNLYDIDSEVIEEWKQDWINILKENLNLM